MENPTRRRVLAAGLTGTALGLLGGRVASASADTTTPTTEGDSESTSGSGSAPASTEAATTTTLPPKRPTDDDVGLLTFAESVELAARDLYQTAVDAGVKDDVVIAMLANHRGYADVIRGILGTRSNGTRDDAVFAKFESAFKVSDLASLTDGAYELESTAVATHIALLGQLQGTDAARLIASILIVEARQAAVLADAGGKGGDFDALFDDSATALTPSSGG